MNNYDVKRLALVLAIQAEVEGMKAANIETESRGYAPAYPESKFVKAAEELRALASKHDQQIKTDQ